MKTKLTLRLDKDVIEKAKEYSQKKGESLSRLVENFFKTLVEQKETEKSHQLTPTVKKLRGLLRGKKVSEADYKKFLKEKYL